MEKKNNTVVFKVNNDTKEKMIAYYQDKLRIKTPPYAIFQAEEAGTIITLYESNKAMFQGSNAKEDSLMWQEINKGNNDVYEIISEDIEEKENCENEHFSKLEEAFEVFRKSYPGRKRGHDTEFDAFKRKHKNWTKIVPLLMPALQRLIEYNKAAEAAGQWKPNYANLSTWLYQARWEEELPEITSKQPKQQSKEQPKTTVCDYEEEDAAFISKNK